MPSKIQGIDMSFRAIEDVDNWVQANGDADYLRACISTGIFGNDVRSIGLANEWLRLKEQRENAEQAAIDRDLRLREVAATEDAAKSAKESALAAAKSARWAVWAVIVAVAALGVAAFK
jgi:hypothetical protein